MPVAGHSKVTEISDWRVMSVRGVMMEGATVRREGEGESEGSGRREEERERKGVLHNV